MLLLPEILTRDSFNIAELSACLRDGELMGLDAAYILSDSPDDSATRAKVVCHNLDPRFVAAGWSAAWVHFAVPFAPRRHTVALRDGVRLRLEPDQRLDLAQMSYWDDDVVGKPGSFVTSRLRTAIDLARFESSDSDVRAPLQALVSHSGATMTDVQSVLERRLHLPHKQRAYRRLADALALDDPINVVHSVDSSNAVQEAIQVHGVTHLKDEAAQR